MKILVTGAAGFIGGHLCEKLVSEGHQVRAVSRSIFENLLNVENVDCGDLSSYFDWSDVLSNIDVVIHLAARVHRMDDDEFESLHSYAALNHLATQNLAMQSMHAGVKRFIFLSTAKVNGEWTSDNLAFSPEDIPRPLGAYATSKFMAENELQKIASEGSMDVVIIRPPIVYGPGVGANFAKLLRIVHKNKILPFGGISSLRSILFVGNLTDFICVCLSDSRAGNQIFMVSDESPIEFSRLIFELSLAFKKYVLLIPVPFFFWKLTLMFFNKNALFDRIFKSFIVTIKKNKNLLNWNPPYSTKDGLRITVNDYLGNHEAKY